MTWREFHLKKGKKILVWKIRNLGESYETMHGQQDGAMQTFSDTPGDKGKPGTKAYVSPKDNCAFHLSREVRKKEEHGYVEVDSEGNYLTKHIDYISWDEVLPKNFCSYKPQTDIEPKALEKLHKEGKVRYSKKMDGMMHLAVHHSWGWEIYTRRMDLTSDRFPNHIEYLNSLDIPIGTIFVGEMVCLDKNGKENFKNISRVCRSLPEETRKLVQDKEVPEPNYVIFDCLFYDKKDLKDVCYDERVKYWKNSYFLPLNLNENLVNHIDFYDVTPETWEQTAKENNWEGFVVVDGSSVPGEKFYTYDGDAKRPKGHHKLKPTYSDECVVYAAVKGSGKRLDTIGAVFIKQKHPETGEWFSCGKCGSGFTEEDLANLEELCKKQGVPIVEKDKDAEKLDLTKLNSLVVEIEFSERLPKTQKFRFPVFLRVRNDKVPEECVAQKLAPDEE